MRVAVCQLAPVLLDRARTLRKVLDALARAAGAGAPLAWGPGDGHGLRVQEVDGWGVGAPDCWENWMPAARMALYAEGEEVHVSLWPGSPANTRNISRILAPDGSGLAALDEPVEGLLTADLDRALLDGERQNLDPAGHSHRSDVFRIEVDRRRRRPVEYRDD